VPNARTLTGPISASRSVTGFCVPHFWSVNRVVSTKYTSALKGLSNPMDQLFSFVRIGRFAVVSS
jgi:hypothetical protein